MEIITDNRKQVEQDKAHLTRKIVEMIHNNIYSCECGVEFKISFKDIKTDTTFFPIIEVKCPGCKCRHRVVSEDMLSEIDKYGYSQSEIMYRCIDEIKQLKKAQRKGRLYV